MKRLVTCESVRKGHPDKLCDRISDSILDAFLREDPNAQCGIEVMAANDRIIIAGEVSSERIPNIVHIVDSTWEAKHVVTEVGYDKYKFTFENLIHSQSEDIRNAVIPNNNDVMAGDQGLIFGYATNETPEMLPLPLVLAHRLCRAADYFMGNNPDSGILPDGKAQVTVEYENGKFSIMKIILSIQHEDRLSHNDICILAMNYILPEAFIDYDYSEAIILINPSGRFVIGGPVGDVGLTGRKIIVDSYGGVVPHGGGAWSGKSPQKVDRSAAYMARYVAKNIVAAGLADRCLVSLSYAIGVAEPVAVDIDTYGTGVVEDHYILSAITELCDFTPMGIIGKLGLNAPIYTPTSSYGHFSDSRYPWEQTDMAESLRIAVIGDED